jgi:DNA-binding transcriptional regulator GbsR (MarR family)
MSAPSEVERLLQLKIDYLAFMEQVHGALGFEPNLIGVLFSLLLEGDYITQDRIMELTGFSRSTVSETLKKLTGPSSSFPILVTRKPGDRRKFYYCPLDFDDYVMTFFTSATTASDFSEEIVREMLFRIESLGTDSREAQHMRGFFTYLLNVVIYIQDLLEYTGGHMEKFFKDPNYSPEFEGAEFEVMKKTHSEFPIKRFRQKKDDSILGIKSDYIRMTLDKAAPVGRRREIAAVSLALILSPDPVTQEEIMEVTGYSRTTVSENLTNIEELNALSVVKKPGDRKKYYRSILKLDGYGTQKFQIQRSGYSQIVRLIEDRFIPELNKIPLEKSRKQKIENFFKKNVRAYGLIIKYISFLHDFMLKRSEMFELPNFT